MNMACTLFRMTPLEALLGVTAHAVKGDRDQCLEAGMDDYITKPVSPVGLSEKIRQHLADLAESAA